MAAAKPEPTPDEDLNALNQRIADEATAAQTAPPDPPKPAGKTSD